MKEKIKKCRNLLLIDDNEDHRHIIRKDLEKSKQVDLNIEEAENYNSAMKLLKQKTYDIILLDIFLPGFNDGKKTLIEIKKNYDIPVVVITAFGDEKKAMELIKNGASDYVVKDTREGRLHLHKLKEIIIAQTELYQTQMELIKNEMRLSAIRKIAHKMNVTLDFNETIETILDEVKKLISNDWLYLLLWDWELNRYITYGDENDNVEIDPELLDEKKSLSGWIYKNKKPIIIDDIDQTPKVKFYKKLEVKVKSAIGVPILDREGNDIGQLVILSNEKNHFTNEDLELLGLFSQEATVAIRNARDHKKHYDLLELLPGGVYQVDSNGYIKFINKRFCEIFGIDAKETALNKHYNELFEIDKNIEEKYISTINMLGEVKDYLYPIKNKKGEKKILSLTSRTLPEGGREGIFIDNTQVKLKEIENKIFLKGIESSKDGIIFMDENDIITHCNEAQAIMHGYTVEYLKGKSSKIFRINNKKSHFIDMRETINQKTKEKSWYGETYNLTKKGNIIPLYLTVSEIRDKNKELLGRVGIAKDMTEVIQLRQQYRQLFKNSPNAILVSGYKNEHHGKIFEINESAEKMFNITRRDAISSSVTEFYKNPNDATKVGRMLKNKDEFIDYITYAKTPSLSKIKMDFPIKMSVYKLKNHENIEYATVGIFRDLTKEIELETKLIEEAKFSVPGLIATAIAHDLYDKKKYIKSSKQLINNILKECEKINCDQIKNLEKCFNPLNQQYEDVMEKIEQFRNRMEFRKIKININDNIKRSVDDARTKIIKNNQQLCDKIKIDKDFQDNLPEIKIVPIELEYIIMNLIFNSFDAIKKNIDRKNINFGNILIKTYYYNKGIIIKIKDNGIGISEEKQKKLFLPQTRFEGSQIRGIGLYLVKKFVNKNNGEIEAISKENKYCEFKITFQLEVNKK